jgi:hypothetical protein
MRDTAFLAVVVAATAVIVNAGMSIFLHFRRASFEEGLARRKFDYDVSLAERKAGLDYLTALHQRKQQLASEILIAFYQVHRMMPAIRSPASWDKEGQSRPRPEEDERPEVEKTRNAYYVVIERLDKQREPIVGFLSQQFTAMALLGLDAGKPFEDFNQLLNRITTSASMLIRTEGEIEPSKTIKWKADIWEGYGDNDQMKAELNRIAEAVEAMCKPILTAKSPVLSDIAHRQPSNG